MSSGGVTATIYRSNASHRFDIMDNLGRPVSWASKSLAPAGGWNTPGALPQDWFVVDFSKPITSFSIGFGDYGPSDDDSPVELRAYTGLGGSGALVGSDSDTWLASDAFSLFKTVSYTGGAARSVLFQSDGPYEQSLFWDNIEVTAIPEPVTLWPAGLGVLGLGIIRRTRPRIGR
jgi:hypothetical protein